MDDNIWEYPFGELEDDDDELFYRPVGAENKVDYKKNGCKPGRCDILHNVIYFMA